MTVNDDPVELIEAGGKLRNGIFLRSVALYRDRVTFNVYASRPFTAVDLESLRLSDNVQTQYEMLPLAHEALDGRGRIEFVPAVPTGWTRLQLSQPGRGFHIVKTLD